MTACLSALFLLVLLDHLANASDLRVVPTLNSSNNEEESVSYRLPYHDRVVPRIDILPLTVQRSLVSSENEFDSKQYKEYPAIVNLKEKPKSNRIEESDDQVEVYPTPRARVQEIEVNLQSNSTIPTPRPRIQEFVEESQESSRSIRSSFEDDQQLKMYQNGKIVSDSDKLAVSARPSPLPDLNTESSKFASIERDESQDEEILMIQDVASVEEKDQSENSKENEVSDDKIQQYIDEIDREQKYRYEVLSAAKAAKPEFSSIKYAIKDDDSSMIKRFRRRAPINDKSVKSEPLFGVSSKPITEPQVLDKHKLPDKVDSSELIDGTRISNEHKSSGGMAYNIDFKPPKAPKPTLDLHPKLKRDSMPPPQDFNLLPKSSESASNLASKRMGWFTSIDGTWEDMPGPSESNELVEPDRQLVSKPQSNEKAFDEVLYKAFKDRPNQNDKVYSQDIQRLTHYKFTTKIPNFVAINPPKSSESNKNLTSSEEEIRILINEKEVKLNDIDENKAQMVFIEKSDINFNLVDADKVKETGNINELGLFWRHGFSIGLHVSPLAMCLGTALLLTLLVMRLAFKIYKKWLHTSLLKASQFSYDDKKLKKHEFDNVSLQTVITN